ncbi:MAG: class I SAM-dependent methyltransferase [Steroidobacteraceae bacterium]|nr:class I SAM-dependent methyltransferase [Steroidobacteraceae bacterium]
MTLRPAYTSTNPTVPEAFGMATQQLRHELALSRTFDEAARQDFVSALRGFILHDMAADMRAVYERDVKPQAAAAGREPKNGSEVHAAIREHDYFRFYSALRVNAQEMVWDSVRDQVQRQRGQVNDEVRRRAQKARGSVTLQPGFEVPKSVGSLDVHLMPGGYVAEAGQDDATQGAFYDNGAAVFFMGLLGEDQGDIGRSIARFVHRRFPDFRPARILDLGCTIGHNTVPWAQEYPEAEVYAIDVAAPALRYGSARAEALGAPVHFRQMDATKLDYPDESFDVVWSSMFLHEVPLKSIRRLLKEAHRVLKKGGLMLHMELPPNRSLSPYDGFYLDWDSWYNAEPFYKTFRDQDPRALCTEAGFAPDKVEEFVVPSLNFYGEDAVHAAAEHREAVVDGDTGRLASGISWYAFGAWK